MKSGPGSSDSTRWSWQKIDIPVVPVTEIKQEKKTGFKAAPFVLPPKYIRCASGRAKFDKAEWSNDQVGRSVYLSCLTAVYCSTRKYGQLDCSAL